VSDATHVARRVLGRMSKREVRIKVGACELWDTVSCALAMLPWLCVADYDRLLHHVDPGADRSHDLPS
jgi:P2-related tail formation protein